MVVRWSILCLLAALIISVQADPWTCTPLTTLNPNPVAFVPFPSTTPQEYAQDNNCKFSFTIPANNYAVVRVISNFATGDLFQISNANGYIHKFNVSNPVNPTYPEPSSQLGDLPAIMNQSFFVPPMSAGEATTIQLVANGEARGYLSFSVEFKAIQDGLTGQTPSVVVTENVFTLEQNSDFNVSRILFTCQDQCVFRTAGVGYDFRYDSCHVLKQVVVDATPGRFTDFVAGLASEVDGVPPPQPAGTYSVVCYEQPSPAVLVVVNNAPDFDGPWSVRQLPQDQPFSFNLTGKYTLTTYSADASIESILSIRGTGNLGLYQGVPGPLLVSLGTVANPDTITSTAQNMFGVFKTYKTSSPSSAVSIQLQQTGNAAGVGDSYPIAIRKGHFFTPNFNIMTTGQNYTTQIGDSTNRNKFNLLYLTQGLGQGTLQISAFQRNTAPVTTIVVPTNMTNGYQMLTGNYFTIQFAMTDSISIGAHVFWQTQAAVDPPPLIETTPEPVTDSPTTAPPKDKGGYSTAAFTLSSFLLIFIAHIM